MEADAVLAHRYRLVHLIASGGMGQVWKAHDAVLDREVAVKVLAAGSRDEAALERFRREAVTMAALQHPNTVLVFDIGTHDGLTFIVMELLPGPTLAQLVATQGPLPESEVARLGAQVAAGLEAAHRAGIVHRDIKPGNLMLGAADEVKIVDFGVARLTQEAAPALTATNTVVGSALYVSPEQARGEPADERSDLYALGCVLTALATGQPPFQSDQLIGALHQHVHSDPPQLTARGVAVSAALEALVAQLLAKNPEDRPASAAEVETRLRAIEAAAAGGPAVGLLAGEATAPLAATVPMASATGTAAGPARRRRAGGAWWVAAGVAVSATVLGALALTQLPDADGGAVSPSPIASPSISPSPSPTPSTQSPTPTAAPATTAAQSAAPDGGGATNEDTVPPGQARDDEPADRGKADEKKPDKADDNAADKGGKPDN
ncbi:hypothetical protein BCR15_05115 [Tessaracoccus lapidicaptus]|uniref:non-specific serine/threonine protein kinase n=1 Tax=Tessaracoccus lapidicaptus TaxID=1427523 RepID=A0A1C0AKN3_9ACTN|nr:MULTISPECIES: serine/threonine-protein kinase [Tessaracoccus]AQX15915.1 serine/threonine protein kinase [Tessaracoccus sp. T2.5-30]OCL33216.1 hypothetical protein BCR15_05115 [Tessaracoccus lapidicaptus]VEP40391.1 Serine/threonine-protein kinase PknB [Tessaracoccus lapidicaptus]